MTKAKAKTTSKAAKSKAPVKAKTAAKSKVTKAADHLMPNGYKRGDKFEYLGGSKCEWAKAGMVLEFLRPRSKGTRFGLTYATASGEKRRTVLSGKYLKAVSK
jgi:hypothetical protein